MAVFLQELCNKLQATLAAAQHPSCINEEFERLSVALTSLDDAKKKKKRNKKSKDVQSWLCDFQQAVYDAYDFVSCLPLRAPQVNDDVQEEPGRGHRSCLGIDNCVPRQSITQHLDIQLLMIRDIRRRVEKLVKKKHPPYAEIHLHLQLQPSDGMNYKVQSLGIPPDELGVIGRDEDREKMIQLLTSEDLSSQMDLSVIAIVGKAGVGKTTLARLVYDDERVKSYFKHKFWFRASEINDDNMALSSSISSQLERSGFFFRAKEIGDDSKEAWKAELAESKFILILDDFRNEVFQWKRLCEPFEFGVNGSKIVITTEDEEAAKTMGLPNCSHHLQDLSLGDSWSLFTRYASLGNNNEEELKQVGMQIVEKLQGSPLAARMVGCLLCSNVDLNDWNIILNADVWKSEPDELCGIPAALWLSYQHLPRHIKRCFAYCSVFPRGHIFHKDELVHMWIAQGFIQPQDGTTMEYSGSEYFDYLVHRSFFLSFQHKQMRVPAPKDTYIMHKMIHRLAVAIAPDESVRLSGVDPSYEDIGRSQCSKRQQKKVRHLYLQSDHLALSQVTGLSMLGDIETLVFHRTNGLSTFNYDALFKKLKSIRVLYLCDMELKILPESIAELKQLRCLHLSNTAILTVSEQVCSLYNLQTLKLNTTFILSMFVDKTLPKEMSRLINLRHLEARGRREIYKIGRLTLLQDLEFSVSREEGHKLEELKYMNQITGPLRIHHLNNVHTVEEAREALLNAKEHLRTLDLSWNRSWNPSNTSEHEYYKEQDDAVLEALKPNPNLKELRIFGNGGTTTPSWLEDGSLCNLEALRIIRCGNLDLLLRGQLQSLKSLTVEALPALQRLRSRFWDGEEEDVQLFPHPRILSPTLEELKLENVGLQVLPGFQGSKSSTSSFSLKSLHISDCARLATLKVGLLEHQNHHRLQALTRLTIKNCPKVVYLPDHGFSDLVSLKYLSITSCQSLECKPADDGAGANLPSSLIKLKIIDCPGLTNDSFFTGIGRLHALTSLVIRIMHVFVDTTARLQRPQLTSLPAESLQHLKALKKLEISYCEHLEFLGLESLETLKKLTVVGCPRLVASLPPPVADTSPLPLKYLAISLSSPPMLTGELLGRLTFLTVLKLMDCYRLACFPKSFDDALRCLVSLQELLISDCYGLESLPHELASIPALKELHVIECRNIKCLPEKGVPLSLDLLVIDKCGQLGRRCLIDREDWHKISHVFYIQVDGRNVRDHQFYQDDESDSDAGEDEI